MTLPRALLVVLVLTALVAAGGLLLTPGRETPHLRVAAPARPPVVPTVDAAVEVLRAWDVRRAAAWSRGNAAALRALYVPGSSAGRRDAAMLRAWTGRGLRVSGIRVQLLAAVVRERSADRIVLGVTDRLAGTLAVGPGVRGALPRDAASAWVVTLRLVAGEWRVGAVRPQARPVASTASTSPSWKP